MPRGVLSELPPSSVSCPALFADAEDLGAAAGALPLGGGSAVLHDDGLGILDLNLLAALDTVGLHA